MSVRLYAMTCGWLTMPLHMFLDGEEAQIIKDILTICL